MLVIRAHISIDSSERTEALARRLMTSGGFVKAARAATISLVNLSPRIYTHAIEMPTYSVISTSPPGFCAARNYKSFFCDDISTIVNFRGPHFAITLRMSNKKSCEYIRLDHNSINKKFKMPKFLQLIDKFKKTIFGGIIALIN